MTAISATFVQLRPINGRKVVQIVLEAPNEHADAILQALGGYPKPDDPQWVGVAPLDAEAAQKPAEKPKGGKLAQRAGILCGEPRFWRYLEEVHDLRCSDAADAANHVRVWCKIDSRAQLDRQHTAGRVFEDLFSSYAMWLRS